MASVYDLAASLLWAITPEYFDLIMAVAEGISTPQQLAELALRAKQEKDWAATLAFLNLSPELQAVALQAGQRANNTRKVEMRGDVAIIPIEGAIFRRANLFSELSSNATSIQVLATDFFKTTRELNAKGVVLNVDSPGGEVNGTPELAGHIFAARSLGIPLWTYSGGTMASASLWLGLAAQKVYVHPSTRSGSIGVMAKYTAGGKHNERVIISSNAPNKNLDPNTAKGELALQKEVDKAESMFIADMARFRGVTTEKVIKDFGAGGTMFGEDAVAAGLVDGISSFEDVIAEMQDVINTQARTSFDMGAVSDQEMAAAHHAVASLLATEQATGKDTEEMALNDTLKKLVAGLSPEEKAELLGQDATSQQPPAPPAQPPAPPVQPPAQQPPYQAAQPPAPPATQANADALAQAQAALATERTARITAECNTFLAEVATKITPAEKAGVTSMYQTLAALADGGTALATYKASIVARPTNPMLKEMVPADGGLRVLQNNANGSGSAASEAEDEAAVIARCLSMTQTGQDAFAALKAGEIKPAAHA
jgi:ClpP class serine protease